MAFFVAIFSLIYADVLLHFLFLWHLAPNAIWIGISLFMSGQTTLKGFGNQSHGGILKQLPKHNWLRCVRNFGTLHLTMVAGEVNVCQTCNALRWNFVAIVYIDLLLLGSPAAYICNLYVWLFDFTSISFKFVLTSGSYSLKPLKITGILNLCLLGLLSQSFHILEHLGGSNHVQRVQLHRAPKNWGSQY